MSLGVHPREIVQQSTNPLLAKHHAWDRVEVGAVADILNGFAFKSDRFNKEGKGLPLLRIRDVGKDHTDAYYDGPYEDRYLVYPGELVIGMDGDFRIARWSGEPALLNQRVCKVTVRDPDIFDPRFLFYLMPGYLDAVHEVTSSVTVKHLSSRTVAELPIPAPSVHEQRLIAGAIETHLSHLDAGVESLHRAKRNIERMRGAVLRAAVEGKLVQQGEGEGTGAQLVDSVLGERMRLWESQSLRHGSSRKSGYSLTDISDLQIPSVPPSWAVSSLESLTSPLRLIQYGILMPKDNVADGVPFVKVRDIADSGAINIPGLHRTAHEIEAKYARSRLKTGDLLVSIRGTYGRVATVPSELDGGNITQDTARVAVMPGLEAAYIALFLRSPVAQRYLQRVARGVAVKGVNIGDLRAMPVPVPPVEEQRRIVEAVSEQMTTIDRVMCDVEVTMKRVRTLRSAVLAAAFSGRLVAGGEEAA